MKIRILIAGLAVVTMALGLALGCSPAEDGSEPTDKSGDNTEQYSVEVFLNDNLLVSVSLDDLLALEQVTLTAENKDEEGPSLLSVLELAGIGEFSEVTVIGLSKGRVASAELVLSRSQINEQVILDITNRGTTKLASPDIPSSNWIIDVSELRVK